ncbi:hypothetical protein BDN70DRAFT_933158 [Pholiota conissans]|uniref:Autophagy-related protein 14 n=1 Tax=Pholiota conissans TaxID=109636 RepID=A0A9P5Z100_9AGAR|nr:hypothetical protein BDN70DRAFT_933158 [Pholiota conissans]
MLSNATPSAIQDLHDDDNDMFPLRRLRHITGIQIRNLTPFPVRDAVTTALSQPMEQSHFAAAGTIDDLGAIVSRRYTRKTSTNSTATRPSLKWDSGIAEDRDSESLASRGRRASTSSTISSTSFNTPLGSSRSTRSLRGHRPRTSSIASSSSNFLGNFLDPTSESSTFASTIMPDNSQTGLEKIIYSRLVETFIAISISEDTNERVEAASHEAPVNSLSALHSAPANKAASSRSQKQGLGISGTKEFSPTSSPEKNRIPGSAPPSTTSFQTAVAPKQSSRTKSSTGKRNGLSFPSSISTLRSSKPNVMHQLDKDLTVKSNASEEPVYFSPIHRPSTNPFFPIDARVDSRDSPQPNTAGQFLKIEVWAKMPIDLGTGELDSPKKCQVRMVRAVNERGHDWRLLESRDVDLTKLKPLPANLDSSPLQLPSNTIVVTMSPPGQLFYLPASSSIPSRPSSPGDGYTSDPELSVRKPNQIADAPQSGLASFDEIIPLSRRRRHKDAKGNPLDFREKTKTATWQELFKFVNLQSLISDNESSLGEIVSKIDTLIAEDTTLPIRRELSERQARIEDLKTHQKIILEQTARKRIEIAERNRRLHERFEMLAAARDALQLDTEIDARVEEQRGLLTTIRARADTLRTSLLSELSTIFPIELYSPPDLLYTILDVPLPIPLNSNDPAPSLAIAEHKDVTEDSVATALGYVAQVLQILAAYMGKSLIYPVTCIGSRSLIKDGISSMVGPRMFPLFSKGVDTYRFEYGVFLLNKDIEMLMSERDLRALDMRHTLPNLKNLLLTLSDDNPLQNHPNRLIIPPASPTSAIGLETPSRESSPVTDDVHTPKPSHIVLETHGLGEGTTTPTASGTTTPTASIMSDDARKQRSFLGFVPFTDFLRGRYPTSVSQSLEKANASARQPDSEGDEDEDEGSESDDEDRTTIHGAASDGVPDTLTRDGGIVAET